MCRVIWLFTILFMALSATSQAQETYQLEYATYLGGSGGDRPYKAETDELGNLYIFGETNSTNFPTSADAISGSLNGSKDAFLVKLDANGALVYSTYIGGSNSDGGLDMVVKSSKEIYLIGTTASNNFPTTSGAYRTTITGNPARFVMKLNPAIDSLAYSTYFYGEQLGIDAAGNVYTVANTGISNLPTSTTAYDRTSNGDDDLYIAKLSADGTTLRYGTYLGGSKSENFPDIAVDEQGNTYISSSTKSRNFPTTAGAFDSTFSENEYDEPDLIVTKLNPDGTDIIYSTYLGGHGEEYESTIRVDKSGCAYISGNHNLIGSGYSDFPTTPDGYDTRIHRHYSGFFTKFDPSGNSLMYSTFFGGGVDDRFDISSSCDFVLDENSNLYFAGNIWISQRTNPGFPITAGAYKQTYDYPASNTFLSGLNASGTDLVYSTMLDGDDFCVRIAIDQSHNIYVVRETKNTELPTTGNALDSSYNGEDWYSGDIYIIKFARTTTTATNNKKQSKPAQFHLCQNYPNPFNPSTTIRFTLSKSERVSLKIYNLVGQHVATLVDDVRSAGEHQVKWQADGLPSGIYLARLQAERQMETIKLIFQK
ncbi:SBBP repeat-containing protein [candidate division KSB1 bacterium]|nr:SBBP repeat-containing protein [candidate division KSB1 bacterium]